MRVFTHGFPGGNAKSVQVSMIGTGSPGLRWGAILSGFLRVFMNVFADNVPSVNKVILFKASIENQALEYADMQSEKLCPFYGERSKTESVPSVKGHAQFRAGSKLLKLSPWENGLLQFWTSN